MAAPHILAQFERCKPWLEAALRTPAPNVLASIQERVASGEMQIWPGEHCAALTEMADFPLSGARVLTVWLAGDLAEALELQPGVEAWARAKGCTRIVVGDGVREWAATLAAATATPVIPQPPIFVASAHGAPFQGDDSDDSAEASVR